MRLALELMEEAENLFEDGASRKVHVMNAIQKTAVYVDHRIITDSYEKHLRHHSFVEDVSGHND